jgi:creatinine amidohydrolase
MLVVTTSWSRLSGAEEIFSADEVAHGIHGGAAETSIMLARENEMVRHQAIADFRPVGARMARDHRWLSTRRPAPFAWQAQDLHPSGVAGDARQASAENGERLIDKGAWAFCELLAEVDQFDIKALSNSPKA